VSDNHFHAAAWRPVEGRDAFLEKRDPDYGRFGRYF
jgi:1,4-dihydroxy-2-naphthoyl-CoA synthase